MKLDLNVNLIALDGSEVADQDGTKVPLSKLLANQLVGGKADGLEPIKAYDWATKLFNDGAIEVDNSDKDKLEKFVSGSELTVLVKGQLLKIVKECKEE